MFIYQFEIILYFITVCNEVTMNEHYNLWERKLLIIIVIKAELKFCYYSSVLNNAAICLKIYCWNVGRTKYGALV